MKVPVEVALLGFPATLGSLAGWDPNYHARLRQVIAAQRYRAELPALMILRPKRLAPSRPLPWSAPARCWAAHLARRTIDASAFSQVRHLMLGEARS